MPNENDRNDRNEMIRRGEQATNLQGQNPNTATWNRDENRPAINRGEATELNRGEAPSGGEGGYEARRGGDPNIERDVTTPGTTGTEQPRRKQRRGFAAMDPAKQREIASKGGKASHEQGTGHEWDSEAAREAGRKGGQASRGGRGKLRSPEGGSDDEGGGVL